MILSSSTGVHYIILTFFAIVPFLFLFVWLFSKEDIGSYRPTKVSV